MAPMNAPARHEKKIVGDTGMDFFEMTSATRAAQKGDRFKIAEMMIG